MMNIISTVEHFFLEASEFMAHGVISRIVQPSDVQNHLVFQYIKLVANNNLLMQ